MGDESTTRALAMEEAARLRCDHCQAGEPMTSSGKNRFHQLGDYQLPCKAHDIRALATLPPTLVAVEKTTMESVKQALLRVMMKLGTSREFDDQLEDGTAREVESSLVRVATLLREAAKPFKCDGSCAGDELGDCSHPEAAKEPK